MSIQSISNLVPLNKNNENDYDKLISELIDLGHTYQKDSFSEHLSDIQTLIKSLLIYSIEQDLISIQFSNIDSLSDDVVDILNSKAKKLLFYTLSFYNQLNKK